MIKCENNGIVTANGTLGELLSEYSAITHSLYTQLINQLAEAIANHTTI